MSEREFAHCANGREVKLMGVSVEWLVGRGVTVEFSS